MKIIILAAAAGLSFASAAGAETVTQVGTTYSAGTWYQSEATSGGTAAITSDLPRSGNGSAYFTTSNDSSKGTLQYYLGALGTTGVELSTLTSVSFDFIRAASSMNNANLAPVLRLNITKDNAFAGSLVFENVYQTQGAAPTSWTTLTATLDSGIFWATNAKLGATQAAANGGQQTLRQWLDSDVNKGSVLRVNGVNIGVGSGFGAASFAGAVDNVNLQFSGGQQVSANFEVAAVPEPATWAMMLVGFGMIGGAARHRRRNVKVSLG